MESKEQEQEECQLCDRIRPSDPRYDTMKTIVGQQGCWEINEKLNKCLKAHRNAWRECKEDTIALTECVKQSKAGQN